jgi:hypothetical protein
MMRLLGGVESTRKTYYYAGSRGYPRSQQAPATPNYSLKARMLRIKQTNGLDFSTAMPTSLRRLPILPLHHSVGFS